MFGRFGAIVLVLAACSGAPPSRPWTFEQLLAPPTASEIESVDRSWPRALPISDARVAATRHKTFPGVGAYEVRVVTHRYAGEERCGFVLVPEGAQRGSLAALIDVRDIRWDYPPRDISRGAFVMAKILRGDASRLAIVMPCLGGESLRIDDLTITAQGDRRNAWEGAALDTIAFTTAALATTPEIDPSRLVVYGYSRGGGVALLVGQRDPRVRAVLAFAAPTDWFRAMNDQDGRWSERLGAAARDPSLAPDTLRSQFLEWFVRDGESLAQLRRRLLGSSPLYFVRHLRTAQVHQGGADAAVPVENATALREAARAASANVEVRIYEGAPHLLPDSAGAFDSARAFLLRSVN
jgi:dienelactone hydrolase